MTTLQHSIITLLSLYTKNKPQEQMQDEFNEQIAYVLLPDAIRRYTRFREFSHFEESSDGSEISYMKFPLDLKNFSKNSFEHVEKFLSSKIIPAVIGEQTHIEKFEQTNQHLPETYYNGIIKHLMQDGGFDNFIRHIFDCSDKYNGNFTYNGEHLDGNRFRQLIADIDMEGFEILSYLAYKLTGITVNQEWFDKHVKSSLDKKYSQDLSDATYSYMKIPPDINKRITEHDFKDLKIRIAEHKTLVPYEQYKQLYTNLIAQIPSIDDEKLVEADSQSDDYSRY